MKSFRFDSIQLMITNERRARMLEFAPNANAIVGGNHRGKSTIVRMLFYSLGCDVKPFGPQWSKDFVVCVSVNIDGVPYSVLRSGDMAAIFNADNTVYWAGTDRGAYRDAVAVLVGFNLRLTPQSGDARLARMSFFFLPSYIDQDGSWESRWDTFRSLGEFKQWQAPTIDFYLGVRPARYWDISADLSSAKNSSEEVAAEQSVLKRAQIRFEANNPRKSWFRDALSFRSELKSLEDQSSRLAKEQIRLSDSMNEVAASKASVDSQMLLVEAALGEHTKDMAYLSEIGSPNQILCPTCGTMHSSSFHERLNLEGSADDLRQVATMLNKERSRLQKRYVRIQRDLEELKELSTSVEETLARQKGNVKLRDVVDQAGIGRAYEALEQEASELAKRFGQLALQIASLVAELKGLNDPQKAAEVAETFNRYYGTFAAALDVPSPERIRRSAIQRKPSLGGSGGPRAILAYHYALAHTARTYTENVLPPVVIDSPHAKAQDQINRPKVTEFIFNNRIKDVQLIAGFEDALPETIKMGKNDKVIVLERPYNVLVPDEFDNVRSRLIPMVKLARQFIANQVSLPLFPASE